MEYTITTCGLTKKFGDFTAVDHINLNIKPGEVCGFVGPNGAGKTTAIRMLCGVLEPSEGSGSILGYDLYNDTELIKQNLGYMSQKFSLYQDLNVFENLDFYAGIYRIDKTIKKNRIQEMISLADLQGREYELAAHLSQGFKQRLALACAVISDPQIIFLDEPTSGVSPAVRRSFFNIIQEQAARGKTIIVSTHFMDEAERCGQIAFFNEGKLLALDNPDNLKKEFINGYLFRLEVDNPVAELDKISKLAAVKDASMHGHALHILLEERDHINTICEYTGTIPQPIDPTLEDVFLTLARMRGGRNNESNTISN